MSYPHQNHGNSDAHWNPSLRLGQSDIDREATDIFDTPANEPESASSASLHLSNKNNASEQTSDSHETAALSKESIGSELNKDVKSDNNTVLTEQKPLSAENVVPPSDKKKKKKKKKNKKNKGSNKEDANDETNVDRDLNPAAPVLQNDGADAKITDPAVNEILPTETFTGKVEQEPTVTQAPKEEIIDEVVDNSGEVIEETQQVVDEVLPALLELPASDCLPETAEVSTAVLPEASVLSGIEPSSELVNENPVEPGLSLGLDEQPAELSFLAEDQPFMEHIVVEEITENSDHELETVQYALEAVTSSPKNSPQASVDRSPKRERGQHHERVISVFAGTGGDDLFFSSIGNNASSEHTPELISETVLQSSSASNKDKRISIFADEQPNEDPFFSSIGNEPPSNQDSDPMSSQPHQQTASSNHNKRISVFANKLEGDHPFFSSLASQEQLDKIEAPPSEVVLGSSGVNSFFDQPGNDVPEPVSDNVDLSVIQESTDDNIAVDKDAVSSLFEGQDEDTDIFESLAQQKNTADAVEEPSQPEPEPEPEPRAQHGEPTRRATPATFSFLEEDEDLLPDDYEEKEAHVASISPSQVATPQPSDAPVNKYQPTSNYAPSTTKASTAVAATNVFSPPIPLVYQNPYAPTQQPRPALAQTTSYMDKKPASNAFDLPTNMVPKSTVRPSASMQSLNNTGSYFGQSRSHVPTLASAVSTPGASSAASYSSSSTGSQVPHSSSLTKSKSFFEELPIPSKRPVVRQHSMNTIVGPPGVPQIPHGPSSFPAGIPSHGTSASAHIPSPYDQIPPGAYPVVAPNSQTQVPTRNRHASVRSPQNGHTRNISGSGSTGSLSPHVSPYAPAHTLASPPVAPSVSNGPRPNPYAPISSGGHKTIVNPYDPSNRISTQVLQKPATASSVEKHQQFPAVNAAPPPLRSQRGSETLGDLPLEMTRRTSTENTAHKYRSAQSYNGGGLSGSIPPAVAESPALPSPPIDNEALLRRQFPVFHFSGASKVSYLIPSVVSYGSLSNPAEVKVSSLQSVLKDEEYSLFSKFPVPLVSNKGALKNKKKELEKWIDEKITSLEKRIDAALIDDRIILWKFLRILVQSDGHVSSLGKEQLETIAVLLNPRSGLKPSNTPQSFSSGSDLYRQQQLQYNDHHSRKSSLESAAYMGTSPTAATSGTNKAFREDIRAIYSSIEYGDRDSALQLCLDKNHWAHALIIASSLGPEVWNQTVAEFVKATIEPVDGLYSKGLSLMYRVFAGAGERAVAALQPPKTMSANLAQNEDHYKQQFAQILADWKSYVAFILLNQSPQTNEAILGLGKVLLQQGFVDAGHICIIMSGIPLFGSPDESGITLVGADSRYQPIGMGRDLDSILMSEIYEFLLLNNPPGTATVAPSPHLLVYKLEHAIVLADYGYMPVAQKLIESISTLVKGNSKIRYNPQFLNELENTNKWFSADNFSTSSGWLSGKKLDKTLLQSFNKFVAGEDEAPADVSSDSSEGAIFKRLASTPGPQGTNAHSTDSSPYAVVGYPGSESHTLNRVQSMNVIPNHMSTGDLQQNSTAPAAPLNRSYSHIGNMYQNGGYDPSFGEIPHGNEYQSYQQPFAQPPVQPYSERRYSGGSSLYGGSRPVTPLAHEQAHTAGYSPYGPSAASILSRPSSAQQARMSPYSPERVAVRSAISTGSHGPSSSAVAPSSHHQAPPPSNPYAPIGSGIKKAPTPVSNPYEPATNSQHLAPTSRSNSVVSDGGAATPYGYNPYGPNHGSSANAASAPVLSYEGAPEQEQTTYQYQPSHEQYEIGASYGYGPTSSGYEPGAGYESGSSKEPNSGLHFTGYAGNSNSYYQGNNDYEPRDTNAAAQNDDELYDAEGGAEGSGYYTPVGGPSNGALPYGGSVVSLGSYQTASTVIPEESEEDAEDLGIANTPKQEQEKKEDKPKKQENADEHKEGKGWFGWLRKSEKNAFDEKPKAVRAKLGEESAFYFDKELKRWVNKKAPLEDQKSAAPPPPPKSTTPMAAARIPSGPPPIPHSGLPSAAGTPAPPSTPGTAAPLPPGGKAAGAKPSTGGLDDLLATVGPPAGGAARRGARKNARNRYVDVMAQK